MAKKVFKYRVYCETESIYVYTWGDSTPTTCPNNNGHTITTSTVSIVDQVSDIVSYGDVSVDNSTSVVLAANAVWTGNAEVVTEYSSLSVMVHSDVASAVDGLELQMSIDGTNWDRIRKLTNHDDVVHSLTIVSKYFRVKYTNGVALQTEFRLQTIYHRFRPGDLSAPVDHTVTGDSDAILTKSVISGKKPDGVYANVLLDEICHLKVSAFNKGLFGEGHVAMHNPVIQNYTPYGVINDQLYTKITATGGTISGNQNGVDVDLSTSDAIGSYAVLRSKRVLKYRPGMINIFRGSARFDTPVTYSLQFTGLGNAGSDLYIGYNGLDFCIRRATGGEASVYKLTITATESTTETATITLDGVEFTVELTDSDGALELTSSQVAHKRSYTGWFAEQIGDTVIFSYAGVGPHTGTYSFTSTGSATGTFTQITAGTALTCEYVTQSNWNGTSRMVTDVDPQMNNLYEIEYSWFGSSNILFKILNPDTGFFDVIHTLRFANTTNQPSLTQPNMYIQMVVASMGTTTPLTMSSACTFGSTMGNGLVLKTPTHSVTNSKSFPKNQETVILAIKNRNTINGFSSQSTVLINKITISASGSKPVKVTIIKNPASISSHDKTDYEDYHYINEANSMVICDPNSNTYTGGEVLDCFFIQKDSGLYLELTGKEIELHQHDVILISALTNGSTVLDLSISFIEDF